MGVLDNIAAIQVPTPKQLIGGYTDIKRAAKRVDVNTINVRLYRPHSPMYAVTKGELFSFGLVTVLLIDVPEKLAWILQDDSIYIEQGSKDEWIECRPDHPITLNVNHELGVLIQDAMRAFPDVKSWYIPSTISSIPVRNVLINHDANTYQAKSEEIRYVVEWLDHIPSENTVTAKFLYDWLNLQIIGSMKGEDSKFNLASFVLGGAIIGLLVMAFMTYLGR